MSHGRCHGRLGAEPHSGSRASSRASGSASSRAAHRRADPLDGAACTSAVPRAAAAGHIGPHVSSVAGGRRQRIRQAPCGAGVRGVAAEAYDVASSGTHTAPHTSQLDPPHLDRVRAGREMLDCTQRGPPPCVRRGCAPTCRATKAKMRAAGDLIVPVGVATCREKGTPPPAVATRVTGGGESLPGSPHHPWCPGPTKGHRGCRRNSRAHKRMASYHAAFARAVSIASMAATHADHQARRRRGARAMRHAPTSVVEGGDQR